ncbi:hypothetical protein B0H13DRAFT_1856970 [Mycena leptocephala]|nr:hypothetical protein B0H13DRAFT_1856970 [Mycena leptocephala]
MVSRKSFENPNRKSAGLVSEHNNSLCPDFTKEADGWVCNICNPSRGDRAHMNIHAAIRHERNSAQHARNVQESNMWWNPPNEDAAISWLPSSQDAAIWNAPLEEDPPLTKEELQMREHQMHVERVADIVPYWIKCVNAAANGEELRLEPFLNTLHDVSDTWMPAQPLGTSDGGDPNRWGVHPDAKSMSSAAHGSKSQTGSRTIASSVPAAGYAFVENIARQESVTTRIVNDGCTCSLKWMPTQEKVKKIDEIVRYLQSASV